jgi:hypothetical protein
MNAGPSPHSRTVQLARHVIEYVEAGGEWEAHRAIVSREKLERTKKQYALHDCMSLSFCADEWGQMA